MMVAAAGVMLAAQARAAFIEAPLPSSAYITFDNLEWAWAYPFPASYPGFDLSYQSQFGWQLPTEAQLASAPNATDFLFARANVPFLGAGSPSSGTDPVSGATFTTTNAGYVSAASAGACATPYFSTIYYNCDWADGNGQSNYGNVWAGLPGSLPWSDQLVVRLFDVPVPGPVVGAGLPGLVLACGGLLAWSRRRRICTLS
jgi:hypothetical protein